MTGKTHQLIGFLGLLGFLIMDPALTWTLSTLIVVVIANGTGSFMPDLDQASNRLWDVFPAGNLIGGVMRRIFGGHRAMSHSLVGVFLAFKLVEFVYGKVFNPSFINVDLVVIATMIGYVCHLIADGLTEEGLPLLFPLKVKMGFPPIKSWRIKTGKWFENLVVLPGVAGVIVWLLINYWSILKSQLIFS